MAQVTSALGGVGRFRRKRLAAAREGLVRRGGMPSADSLTTPAEWPVGERVRGPSAAATVSFGIVGADLWLVRGIARIRRYRRAVALVEARPE